MLANLGEGGIYKMFLILAVVYFVMMFTGHLLLKKPEGWHEPQTKEKGQSIMDVIKTKPIMNYVGIWLMFYINITCGLALISQEKMIVKCLGLASVVGIVSTVSAVFNAVGRLGLSAMADKMKDRNTMYKCIFVGSIICTLLSDQYGMGSISALHGITLSAWAFAGLTGNQMANWIVQHFGQEIEVGGNMVNPVGYQTVLYVTLALYVVALFCSFVFLKAPQKEN